MKKIGIVGWKTGENSFGVSVPYINYFETKFDAYVSIISPNTPVLKDLDLLVLPGGMDLNASMHSDRLSYFNSNIDYMKQFFVDVKLRDYLSHTPVFGICLGAQQLSVLFGAKINQHRETIYSDKSRDERVEALTISPGYAQKVKALRPQMNIKEYKVNSLHHQTIVESEAFNKFCDVVAKSTSFFNVEAFKHKTLPVAGVQYHPEELLTDSLSNILIDELLNNKR